MTDETDVVSRLANWSSIYSQLLRASKSKGNQLEKQLAALQRILQVDDDVDVLRALSDFVTEARLLQSDICDSYPATEMLRPFFAKIADDLLLRLSLNAAASGWGAVFSEDGASKLQMAAPMLATITGVNSDNQQIAIERLNEILGSFVDEPLDDSELNDDLVATLSALISAVSRGDNRALRLAQLQLRGMLLVETEDAPKTRSRVWKVVQDVATVVTLLQGAAAAHAALPAPPQPANAEIVVLEESELRVAPLPLSEDE